MLCVHQVSYQQPTGLRLSQIDIDVAPGQVVAVVGPNGSGKSTLVKLMAGILQADSGQIRVNNQAVAGTDLSEYVAYLPQKLEVHWPLRVEQVVALGGAVRRPRNWYFGAPALNKNEVVAEAMARLDLSHLAQRSVDELSGGELTRALLARAVAQQSEYLLVDEPVNNLDPAHQFSIMQVLSGQANAGRGVLAVLHDLSLVKRFCDSVVVLAEGNVVAKGAPGEILTAELLKEVFAIASDDLDYWLHKIG